MNDEKILKTAAVYDLVVTGLLVLPPVVLIVLKVIAYVDASLGFGTEFTVPDATTIFFVNLAAATVIAWAAIRIMRPSREALLIDIGYRVVLVICQVWAVLAGATPVLLGISAALLLIAGAEWVAWKKSDPTGLGKAA